MLDTFPRSNSKKNLLLFYWWWQNKLRFSLYRRFPRACASIKGGNVFTGGRFDWGTFWLGDVFTGGRFDWGDVLTEGTFWLLPSGDVFERGRFDWHPLKQLVDLLGWRAERKRKLPVSLFFLITSLFLTIFSYIPSPMHTLIFFHINLCNVTSFGNNGIQVMSQISNSVQKAHFSPYSKTKPGL